jgi:polyphenol oxidase
VAVPGPVLRPTQVHGAGVLVAGAAAPAGTVPWAHPGGSPPPEGDAVVAVGAAGCPVVVVADCGALALASPQGQRAAVHVGWRGLMAGVVEAAAGAMAALGADPLVAGLGPCIHPCCYEFAPAGVAAVVARYGPEAAGWTRQGSVALDLPGAIRAALRRAGVPLVVDVDACTGCAPGWYSHRRRGDTARQALVVWADPGVGSR